MSRKKKLSLKDLFRSSESEEGILKLIGDSETDGQVEKKQSGFRKEMFNSIKSTLSSFILSNDKKRVITGGLSGTVICRELEDPVSIYARIQPHSHTRVVKMTSKEEFLFTGGSDNCIKMYTAKGFKLVSVFKTNSRVLCIDICESKNLLFCGSYSGRIYGWNYKTQQNLTQFKDTKKQHKKVIMDIKVFNDTILSASGDKTIKQWKIQDGEEMHTMDFSNVITKILPLSRTRILIQNQDRGEIYSLKEDAKTKSIENLEKEYTFLKMSNFAMTNDKTTLVGWNRYHGKLEFYNLKTKEKITKDIKIDDAVFVRDITPVKIDAFEYYVYFIVGSFLDRRKVSFQESEGEDIPVKEEKEEEDVSVETIEEI